MTLQFDPNFTENVKLHKRRGTINSAIEVLNLYETSQPNSPQIQRAPHNPDWTYFRDSNRPNAFRVFDTQGRYIRYESRRRDETLEFVDHFTTPWRRTSKTYYDPQGFPRRDHYMSADGTKPQYQVIRDNTGRPFASSKLSESGAPISFFAHREQIEYKSEIEMAVPWLQNILENFEATTLFIDKREFVEPLSKICDPRISKVYVMHSNHLDHPFNDVMRLSPSAKDAFDGFDSGEIDRMVFLTSNQAEDAKRLLKTSDRVAVINNFLAEFSPPKIQREDHLLVSIARYHYAKNLGTALEVFKLVLETIPDARYEIFGYGPELESLQARAEALGISDSVSFRGHTDEPISMLARGSASLLTSRYEGMPLTLLESQAVGTPPVAFDIKYGPSEIIRDGVDGFLIENSDRRVAAAADAVVRLFEDEALFARMSAASMQVFERFSEARAANERRSLIADL